MKSSEEVFTIDCKKDYLDLEAFRDEEAISKKMFARLYRSKKILVNGEYRRKSLALRENDRVELLLDEEEENTIEPEDLGLEIIYEDRDMLIVDKPAFMPVHPTKYHQRATLANGISYYFKMENINKKIRLVNRLDENTSGLILVAKSQHVDHQLSLQFRERRVVKKYLALVEGCPSLDKGKIEEKIYAGGGTKKMVDSKGKDALTYYRVLERYGDRALLELEIPTGRSHQIRVHLSYLGHPIVGDSLYGSKEVFKRQALHSSYLGLVHPRRGEFMGFKSALPSDLMELLK